MFIDNFKKILMEPSIESISITPIKNFPIQIKIDREWESNRSFTLITKNGYSVKVNDVDIIKDNVSRKYWEGFHKCIIKELIQCDECNVINDGDRINKYACNSIIITIDRTDKIYLDFIGVEIKINDFNKIKSYFDALIAAEYRNRKNIQLE